MAKKITLFHADWCIHCKNFLPEWNKIMEFSKKYPNLLIAKEYEQTKNPEIMEQEKISGYPTIIIESDGKKEKYTGDRTKEKILEFMNIKCDDDVGIQNGGNMDDGYRSKYLKYKTKYLKLKYGVM